MISCSLSVYVSSPNMTRQQLGNKRFCGNECTHATIGELLDAMLSVCSAVRT
jgi:hypothetical protein